MGMNRGARVRMAHFIGHLRDQYHWHKTEHPGFVIGHVNDRFQRHNHTDDPPIGRRKP